MCEGTAVEAANSGTKKSGEMHKAGKEPTLLRTELTHVVSACAGMQHVVGWTLS